MSKRSTFKSFLEEDGLFAFEGGRQAERLDKETLLIYCADGNPKFARAAIDAGWLYGAQLPNKVYEKLFFADQNWKAPDRRSYMKALKKHKPVMATVLDWEREEQEKEVLSWAEEAAQYVEKLVIIPKVRSAIAKIPERIGKAKVILGYSVETNYGGTRVPLNEFLNRPVHLLGGSPHKQLDLAYYLNVHSCDGNMMHQQAHKCRFWREKPLEKGHWIQLNKANLGNLGKGSNLAAFKQSLLNIKAAWNKAFSCRKDFNMSSDMLGGSKKE